MARLLTLALAETTSSRLKGYDVVGWDEDARTWVKLHVPMDQFVRDGRPVWDIFGWTEASVLQGMDHPEHRLLVAPHTARLVGHIKSWDDRKALLERLADRGGMFSAYQQGRYVGLIKPASVDSLEFKPKHNQSTYERTIAWRAALPFHDGVQYWSGRCKDMRWKRYWVDICQRRPQEANSVAAQWVSYIKAHPTYFIFSCWDWHGHQGDFERNSPRMYAITGVHCLPVS